MYQKKGLSYVDVAVSAAVFILYLVIALVIFRPGIKSDFRSDILTSIVEQNIKNDIYWTAQKYPIYINHPSYPIAPPVVDNNMILYFPFNSTIFNNTNSKIVDINLKEIPFKIDNPSKNNLTVSYSFRISESTYKNIIYLIHIDDAYFANPNLFAYPSLESSPSTFDFKYGVKEDIRGISNSKLNSFFISDYSQIKNKWGYPTQREFAILIYDGKNPTNSSLPFYTYKRADPSSEVQVYTVEYVDYLLYENSSKKLVTVVIQAW